MRSSSRTAWIAMAVVAVLALGVGLLGDDEPRTTDERVTALSETVRCPTCRSQSVAESEAPIAREIRAEIDTRVEAGETDDEIRDFLVSRYGQEVLLTPPSSGLAGLVWVIPVVASVLAGVGLWLAFRRWRETPTVHASASDRELVDAALHHERSAADGTVPSGEPRQDDDAGSSDT